MKILIAANNLVTSFVNQTSFARLLQAACLCLGLWLPNSVMAGKNSLSFLKIGTEHGLPQSTVNSIYQDSRGFIWVGTFDGVARFDGYQFVSFKHDPLDPSSISSNVIVSIIEDDEGYLWIATAQNGVNRFNPKSGEFTRFMSNRDDFDSLSHPQTTVIHQDTKGRIWIGTQYGLNLYLPEKNAFAHFYNNPLDNQSLPEGSIVDIVDDGSGNLWIATDKMLTHFDIEQQVFTSFNQPNAPTQINDLFLDIDNSLWLGTRLDGLYRLDPQTQKFEQYQHDPNDSRSISQNDIRAILRMENGDLWIGTDEGGINVRRKGSNQFLSFNRNASDPHSLTLDSIWSLYQDNSGLIWIGTAGGGLNLTLSFENRLSRLNHNPFNTNSLSHEFVWDLELDNQGDVWIATRYGIDRYNPKTDQFSHFNQFVDKDGNSFDSHIYSFTIDQDANLWLGNTQGQLAVYSPQSKNLSIISREDFPPGYISYNRVRMIENDRFGNIWVGTDDGLIRINQKTQQIIQDFRFSDQGDLGGASIRVMLQDDDGIIWFGTWGKGLLRYDPEFNSVTRFEYEADSENTISNNIVRSLYKDIQGNLWIGTFNGLNRISAKSLREKSFQFDTFFEKDGLPTSAIYSIAADKSGRLWLGTNKGLAEFDPQTLFFKNYSIEDGLTANEFSGNAVAQSASGEIYFGSVNGVTIVDPQAVNPPASQPQLTITNVEVQGQSLLPKGVAYVNQVFHLDYDKNDLSFEFATLDFRHPSRNRYQYRLIPYNQEWSEATTINRAVFTNLDPNQYTFELRAVDRDGLYLEENVTLRFTVHPPFWKTWYAYVLYFILTISFIAYYLNKHEKKIQEQKAINEHLRKVDQLKDEFLANTSHELRTPLNGIIGIAESLKEGVAGLQNQNTLNHLQLIIEGGKRLAQLINDILDFKKLSHQNLVLHRKATDLNSITHVVVSLLKPLAEEKRLKINNALPQNLPLIFADENRIQQILHNLIGNAIKYTESGTIEIFAKTKNNFVEIAVADTGIGIDKSQQEIIFQPFEQAELPVTTSSRGTGLGLSVSLQLIEEHGGQLWVDSQLGQGSTFYFTMPVWLENTHQAVETPSLKSESPTLTSATPAKKSLKTKRAIKSSLGSILIADDDPINLQVLTDLLEMNNYQVKSASNGTEAVSLALENKFDLAVIDIMMPGLSGYEVCEEIRKNYSAIELPILLLSARNQPGDVSAGFKAGANDYVSKPIERQVLLSRISTLMQLNGLVEARAQKAHTATLQQACERLGKYFPKQMVNQIITDDSQSPLVAKRKQITVLFADLSGFTSVSDRFEPEAITDILNSFLGEMGQLIESHGGMLNEILGDGLVVLFGALENMDKVKQAQSAAALALDMQLAMKKLADRWLEAGFDHSVKLRIGIHQDFATVGNFGSREIVAFRAVGSGVNLAARLENYTQGGKILVSYPIYAHCRQEFEFTELKEINFKGFNYAHRVCHLIGVKSKASLKKSSEVKSHIENKLQSDKK